MNIDGVGAAAGARILRTLTPAQTARSRADFADALRTRGTIGASQRTERTVDADLTPRSAPTPTEPTSLEANPRKAVTEPIGRAHTESNVPVGEPTGRQLEVTPQPSQAPPAPQQVLGDIDGSGRVDVFDFSRLAAAYATANADADLDQSGAVDEIDMAILRKNFGQTTGPGEDEQIIAEPADAAPEPPALAGDINHDGRVDVFDFSMLAKAFGTDNADADLFADGTVDEVDLAILKQNFGRTA